MIIQLLVTSCIVGRESNDTEEHVCCQTYR